MTPPPRAASKHPPEGCRACRTLPDGPPERGTLYLSPPTPELFPGLRGHLNELGVDYDEPYPGMVGVAFTAATLEGLSTTLAERLPSLELQTTRALVVPDGHRPTVADLMNTQALSTLLAAVRSRWLAEVLKHGRLETHFQPIVYAGTDAPELFGYECLVRGRDEAGELIPPKTLFDAARAADLLFHLDRASRLCHIRAAAAKGVGARLFLNFNPSSIYTPAFCLKSTFQAVEQAGLRPGQIVFEVVETEEIADTSHLLGILEVYRKAGFGVALDDVGAGYNSLTMLTRLRPNFVKLDMGLTRGVDRDPYKAQVARKLLEMAHGLGVRTVVEGVETVGEYEWACSAGADFVQGYLFARPAAEPPVPRLTA